MNKTKRLNWIKRAKAAKKVLIPQEIKYNFNSYIDVDGNVQRFDDYCVKDGKMLRAQDVK